MDFIIDNPKIVERYLRASISLINADRSLSGYNIFTFNQFVYALGYRISLKNGGFETAPRADLIRKAIFSMFDNECVTIEKFTQHLQMHYTTYKKQKQTKFFIVFPSKLPITSIRKRYFTIANNRVYIKSYSAIKKFDICNSNLINEQPDKPIITDCFKQGYSYFVLEGYSRHKYEFYQERMQIYEMLRSIFYFAENYRSIRIFGRSRPISLIGYPQIGFIFDKNFKFIDVISHTDKNTLDNVNVHRFNEREVIESTNKILTKINSIPDEKLRNVFILAFEIHNSALDNYDEEWLCCFKFWQILERLALADQNLKYEDLCKRLLPFIGEIEPYYDIIQLYLKKRHNYVHNGNIHDFTYQDVEVIKDISEFLLLSLLYKAGKMKNLKTLKGIYDSIDIYFKNVDVMDPSSLKTIKEKMRYLRRYERSSFFKKRLLV